MLASTQSVPPRPLVEPAREVAADLFGVMAVAEPRPLGEAVERVAQEMDEQRCQSAPLNTSAMARVNPAWSTLTTSRRR